MRDYRDTYWIVVSKHEVQNHIFDLQNFLKQQV